MFGYIKGPKKLEGTNMEMKVRQGYNNITKQFFISITDRKTGITCRINMDEEFYQAFHNMGNFTFRQTKKDETEFEQESNRPQVDPDDEMKGFVSVP